MTPQPPRYFPAPVSYTHLDVYKRQEKAGVVGTPGAGFGQNGEGFFRLTAFGTHEATKEALERIKSL